MPALDAEELAKRQAKETMASIAALHNPDLVAGGKDVISDFGDRQVNSSIGSQWKSKLERLAEAAKEVSKLQNESAMMNVKLHKC